MIKKLSLLLLLVMPHALYAGAATKNVGWCNAQVSLIVNATGLSFGSVMVAGAGTVVVDVSGARSTTGAVVPMGGSVSSSLFDIVSDTGCVAYAFAITLPASATLTDGVNNMTVDTFTSTPAISGSLDAAGVAAIAVGATLHVNASQPAALYTGTFPVDITFQ